MRRKHPNKMLLLQRRVSELERENAELVPLARLGEKLLDLLIDADETLHAFVEADKKRDTAKP